MNIPNFWNVDAPLPFPGSKNGYRTLRPHTLRHQDTLEHFGTGLKTLRHQKRGTRHFDTSAEIEEKPGHFDPGQFRWDTAPRWFVLNFGTNFVVPMCLGAEVSCGWSVRLQKTSDIVKEVCIYCNWCRSQHGLDDGSNERTSSAYCSHGAWSNLGPTPVRRYPRLSHLLRCVSGEGHGPVADHRGAFYLLVCGNRSVT